MDAKTADRNFVITLAQVLKKSPSNMAVDAGIAASTLTRVVNKTHRLSLPTIEKLRAAYPEAFAEIDKVWVHDPSSIAPLEPGQKLDPARRKDYAEIPVLPSLPGEPENWEVFPRDALERRNAGRPEDFRFLYVRGDAMRKSGFYNGDRVLIDTRDTDPAGPGVFAIADGDIHALRMVERIPAKPGWLRIYTDFRTQGDDLKAEDVSIVGRPAWVARDL